MKTKLGILLIVTGAILVIFGMYLSAQLNTLAHEAAPNPSNHSALKIIAPEIFESPTEGESPSQSPAELAQIISTRIYGIGGFGLAMATIGGVICIVEKRKKRA